MVRIPIGCKAYITIIHCVNILSKFTQYGDYLQV